MTKKNKKKENEWTDEQRRLLVECAWHATIITGHNISEVAMELARLVREYKKNRKEDK